MYISTDAFNYVRNNVYESHSGRSRKVVVALLSVMSTQTTESEYIRMSERLWSEGYDVITVGVGNEEAYAAEVNTETSLTYK